MKESKVFDQFSQDKPEEENEFTYLDMPGFRKMYPNMHDLLFLKQNRGNARLPAKFSVFYDEGRFKVCITCPSEGVYAFLTLSDPAFVMKELEVACAASTLDWREEKSKWKKGKPPH